MSIALFKLILYVYHVVSVIKNDRLPVFNLAHTI